MDEKNNVFIEEEKLIDDELKNIDDLYTEIKSHFDSIKGSYAKGSLTFIEKQTSNLVSLKLAKLNLVKEKINMKKALTDFEFKDKQLESKSKEMQGLGLSIDLYKQIVNIVENGNSNNNDDYVIKDEIEYSDDVDSELDELLKDDDYILLKEDKDSKESSEDNSSPELKADRNGNVYLLSENGKEFQFLLKSFNIDDELNVVYDDKNDIFYPLLEE